MGQIHKIGDEYYIEFTARGLVYQQKAGQDLPKAQELLEQIENKIANGELQTIVREIALDVFFAEFLKFSQSRYHPRTVQRLAKTIEHFTVFLRAHFINLRKLSEITPRVIEVYKSSYLERCSAKKVNLTLLLLREVLEYGRKTGYINDNPTLHITLLNTRARRLRLSDDLLARILEGCGETYCPIFLFLRHTGLRLSELEDLTWQQVDWNQRVLFVKSREIPLNAQALNVLKDAFHLIIDHKAPVFPDLKGRVGELKVRFNKAVEKAGFTAPVSIASLRHSFGCNLLEMRLSFLAVGRILGVHDIAKLMIYASYIPSRHLELQ